MRVGLLVGREETFPAALIEEINRRGTGVKAEMVQIGGTRLNETVPYRVILDRISHEVPYYRAYLTKAVADGAIVINNPFWWTADNKFIECVLAEKLGVAVPRTVLLPNVSYEADIIDQSLRNLTPIDWDAVAAYVGMPAVLKPALGGGSKNISVVESVEELIAAHQQSGNLTMVVQEAIVYENYARCWTLGRQEVRVSGYDYHKPRHVRYRVDHGLSPALYDRIVEHCLTLTRALGYDFDTLEWAIREDVPYAIDFLNPAPDCEPTSVNQENFLWVVEHAADLCIRYALSEKQPPAPDRVALVGAIPPIGGTVETAG
jgi:glutathione synthase/RimK-type ligase-like ATP-grasp enzyme